MKTSTSVPQILQANGSIRNNKMHNHIKNSNDYTKNSSLVRLSLKNGLSPSSIYDIFELLSAYSYRSVPEEEFDYERNGEMAVRIASWNLDQLTLAKVRNLGVIEVICCTILENRWSVVAIQDVQDPLALKMICDELNTPSLSRIFKWKKNSRCWNFCICNTVHPKLGYIYDADSGGMRVEVSYLSHRQLEGCESVIVTFSIGQSDFTVINTLLTPGCIPVVENNLMKIISDIKGPVLVVGDLNNIAGNTATELKRDIAGLKAIIPLSLNTSCQHEKTTLRFTDTILVNELVQLFFSTGIWGIVRQGLNHLAIPQDWDWGGPVSSHCPVWGEFYVLPNQATTL